MLETDKIQVIDSLNASIGLRSLGREAVKMRDDDKKCCRNKIRDRKICGKSID